ncbi:MAG: DinB family protein [Aureibaculum sp.]|nr:DinB family protein [Aureibaculum sp.]
MIRAIEHNLNRGVRLLDSISDNQFSDTSVAPYNSSIGGHIRHILDIFDCIFDGLESKQINLAARKRNELAETHTAIALDYFDRILSKLKDLEDADLDQIVEVSDDLGKGVIVQKYTLGSALIQAHSHAIHHFASLGYIICQLGIELPDDDFGYNPTTPRTERLEL